MCASYGKITNKQIKLTFNCRIKKGRLVKAILIE